jgi:mRNA interferase RelE/StbE
MKVTYTKSAIKALEGLEKQTKHRIRQGIEKIPEGDIRPMKGTENSYRLRVGDFRILFYRIDKDTIRIDRISPRGDAYKGV